MNYVYARLSKKDLYFTRIGGSGLGNIMFSYARAIVFAKKNNLEVIWPTWCNFTLGPIFRKELDKRFYNDLFINKSNYIDSWKKIKYLNTKKILPEKYKYNLDKIDNAIIEFYGFDGCFEEIINDSKIVYEDIVRNLNPKNRIALSYDFSDSISLHIRLGDFNRATEKELREGKHNSSIPIEWYINILHQIRKITGKNIKAYIFSDGTDEELENILRIENVERISFGTSIADIIALSRSKLFIASGSSFSMWARYLGRLNTICYKNQMKQKILTENDNAFEVETDNVIPREVHKRIKDIFQ